MPAASSLLRPVVAAAACCRLCRLPLAARPPVCHYAALPPFICRCRSSACHRAAASRRFAAAACRRRRFSLAFALYCQRNCCRFAAAALPPPAAAAALPLPGFAAAPPIIYARIQARPLAARIAVCRAPAAPVKPPLQGKGKGKAIARICHAAPAAPPPARKAPPAPRRRRFCFLI